MGREAVSAGRTTLLLAGAAAMALGAWWLAHKETAVPKDRPRSDGVPAWRGRFPNVPLVTSEGRTVYFYDDLLRGRLVTLSFFYIECEGTCPGVTSTLVQVGSELAGTLSKELRLLCISLAPERDTPERLREYARRYHAGPEMLFLTGRPEDIDLVRRSMGFSHPEDPRRDADRTRHAALLRVGNVPDQWWTECPSSTSPDQLVRLLRSLDRQGGEGAAPPEVPAGPPVEFPVPADAGDRQALSRLLEDLERLWMSRWPMDRAPYQDLIIANLASFLQLTPEAAGALKKALLEALGGVSKARRQMEAFRAGRPYDVEDPDAVRRYRAAWDLYRRDRAAALSGLAGILPDGPRSRVFRDQAARWVFYLEDEPDPVSLPQDRNLVPIRKR
jgi:protein SCO1/2